MTVEEAASIGRKFDAKEAALLRGSREEDYTNVSADGFFSVEVMVMCLKLRDYVMVPLASPEMAELRKDVGK